VESPTNRCRTPNDGEFCRIKVPDVLDEDKWFIFSLLMGHAADHGAPQEAVAPVQLSSNRYIFWWNDG